MKSELMGLKLNYPKCTLHELFAIQAKLFPNSIALEMDDRRVTYGELEKMINQMANYLWSQGVRPGQIVAVSLDRTPELIATLFAVLQCGAAYVPIDSSYPTARLEMIIEDASATFYIAVNSERSFASKVTSISIDTILESIFILPVDSLFVKVPSESPAYIIYTSGSTGKPKGVQVAHRNVINLVYSMANEPGITTKDKIFSVTTISFDAMVMEIYLPLLFGACIVLVDENTRKDGQLLLIKAIKDKVTIMWGTPSIWQILLDSGWEKPIHLKALIGGEQVPLQLAQKLLELCDELWNIYGPTETTVCSLLTKISKQDNPITIGKPIANTQIYLLNPEGLPVIVGEVGQITIAGDGVSLGYLNRPKLTKERFVSNTFDNNNSAQMYLSGDYGKLLPNGQLQCIGRIDQQVKIRGYRIELGEIESILNSLTEIKKASVIVSTHIGGEPNIIAYLQSTGENQETYNIRIQLEKLLPEFMIPSFFMWVSHFPTTPNGKIDKKNLPVPEYSRSSSAPLYKKATTEIQNNVAKAWTDVLQIPEIGIDDNFFELGGTSLLAQKVIATLASYYNYRLAVTKLYRFPTISEISCFLETEKNPETKIIISTQRSPTIEAHLTPVLGNPVVQPNNASNSDLEQSYQGNYQKSININTPPVPGAKLGRDENGDPAWFVENSEKRGEYVKFNL